VLVTPDYAYGSIKSHDNSNGTGHSLITGNRVDIGDLHPGEMVEVKMWHKWMFGFEDFRITHKDGVGKIIELRKVNPFWYYLSRNWLIIPWLLTAVSMIPLFGILVPRYFFSTGRIKE